MALKDGYKDNQKLGFKRTHFPWLYRNTRAVPGQDQAPMWYSTCTPRVEALSSKDKGTTPTEARNKGKLNQTLFPAFNWDRIYLALQDYRVANAAGAICGWSEKADRLLCGHAGLVHVVSSRRRN